MRQRKNGKSNLSGEAFWRFSLAFYARPGIAEALIALQDRAGRDVNLMLFAMWRGAVHGKRLRASELGAAEAAIAPLRREIVGPLCALRRRLKTEGDADIQALRRRILGLELTAERAAQSRLATIEPVPQSEPDRCDAAEANLLLSLGAEAQSAEAAVLCRGLRDFLSRD
ncbi:MAG TPA: TIGR02444 family protein [Stellaceae bacterium]|jgi:uncharacterized protein (TIGR02444 family)